MSAFIDYVKGSFREFRYNVEFPTWNDVSSSTLVVAGSAVILAIFLFGIDELFRVVMDTIYTQLDALVRST